MTENEFTRFMAIDFGLKRIGIALSDPLKTFATPFVTIQNDKYLFKRLEEIIKEKNVERILLGIPDDSQNSVHNEVLKFKEQLEEKFKIPIILWNETHTSRIAERHIIESVKSKKKRRDKGLLDKHSAAIILTEYLDSLQR